MDGQRLFEPRSPRVIRVGADNEPLVPALANERDGLDRQVLLATPERRSRCAPTGAIGRLRLWSEGYGRLVRTRGWSAVHRGVGLTRPLREGARVCLPAVVAENPQHKATQRSAGSAVAVPSHLLVRRNALRLQQPL